MQWIETSNQQLTKWFRGLPLLPLQWHPSPFSGSIWYLLFITYFFVSRFHLMFFVSLFHLYSSDHNPFWATFLFTFWDSLDCFWLVSVSHSTFLMQWVRSFWTRENIRVESLSKEHLAWGCCLGHIRDIE